MKYLTLIIAILLFASSCKKGAVTDCFNTTGDIINQERDIESFNKNDLILRVKSSDQEKLLIAYNKKRINETDIIKANKKAQESNLPYIILSLGGPLKKLDNLINAIKNLTEIEKL